MIGIINFFELVYPNNILNYDKQMKKNVEIVKDFIFKDIKDREESFPKHKEMIDYYNKIISIAQKKRIRP